MNKAELIEQLAMKSQLTKKQVEELLDALTSMVTSTIKAGGEVTITGFGTFLSKIRAARMGVNPQNPSQKMQIPAVLVPKFKAGKALKDSLKSKA